MGSYSLLQGIFLTQGLNLGLLCCRQILYHLSYQGSLKLRYVFSDTQIVEHSTKSFAFPILIVYALLTIAAVLMTSV